MPSNPEVQQQMFNLIKQWEQCNLSQKAFCKQSDLPYHVFHYWYKHYRLKENMKPSPFVKLKLAPAGISTHVELILADGKRLLFHQPISSDYLRAIIA